MHKKIATTLLLAASLFLTACSGGSPAHSSPSLPGGPPASQPPTGGVPSKITLESVPIILDPSRVPPEPEQSANDATVVGIDSNNNGIRDDVERWIAQTYPTSAKSRAVAAQGASVFQKTIRVGSKPEALQVEADMSRYTTCLLAVVNDGAQTLLRHRALKKEFINTPERFAAFDAYDTHLSGQVFFSKKDKSKEANCDVNIDSLPN